MGVVDDLFQLFRFKDTIFYKDSTDLTLMVQALEKLHQRYPENEEILREYLIAKKGLVGEDEVAYQLSKANIGMVVLRDIRFKNEDQTAQIDYVIITPVFTYYVECKNWSGNVIVDKLGNFQREYKENGKTIRKGHASPLTQVETQRDVVRKVWEKNSNSIQRFIVGRDFNYYHRVLVVFANEENILKMSQAPKSMKYKVLKADGLVRQITYDLNHSDEYFVSKKNMLEKAQVYMDWSDKEEKDYDAIYQEKFASIIQKEREKELKEKLITFRTSRYQKMNIKAYEIFNNKELEQIIEQKIETLDDLARVLPDDKVNAHGKQIIEVIQEWKNNSVL